MIRWNSSRSGRRISRHLRPTTESLEGRLALSTAFITVTSASDTPSSDVPAQVATPGGFTGSADVISLRQAIQLADAVPSGTSVQIDFNIPAGGASPTLEPTSPLPTITRPVTIDGLSQSQNMGQEGAEPVLLDGVSAPDADGLVFSSGASGSVVEGLGVTNFGGVGLHFEGASNVQVVNDAVGFSYNVQSDTIHIAPNRYGVEFDGGSGETINNDVLSGNTIDGLRLIGTSNSTVENTSIGSIDAAGFGYDSSGWSVGNGGVDHYGSGLYIDNGSYNTVTNDIIANNGTYGILISGPSSLGNQVTNSKIGTDPTGYLAQPNMTGLEINGGASYNVASNNVISGNSWDGVEISGSGTIEDELIGNAIGMSADLTTWVANWNGIQIDNNAAYAFVYNNTISGNSSDGVFLAQTQYDDLEENQVGLGIYGTPAGNGNYGIILVDGSVDNTIYNNNIQYNGWEGLITVNAWWDNSFYYNNVVNNGGSNLHLG